MAPADAASGHWPLPTATNRPPPKPHLNWLSSSHALLWPAMEASYVLPPGLRPRGSTVLVLCMRPMPPLRVLAVSVLPSSSS